jgi:hypothetical protein
MLRLDNLRLGGALRWKVEDHRLGRSGSEMWKASTSKVVALPMSVKDHWVGPREQVLNVPIVSRRYRPDKPSSLPSTKSGFTPTASMAFYGEKLGTDPWIGQPVCCGLFLEPFFSGVVALSNAVDDFMKGCYALTT